MRVWAHGVTSSNGFGSSSQRHCFDGVECWCSPAEHLSAAVGMIKTTVMEATVTTGHWTLETTGPKVMRQITAGVQLGAVVTSTVVAGVNLLYICMDKLHVHLPVHITIGERVRNVQACSKSLGVWFANYMGVVMTAC